jgi:Spy/CpxP family protein refolding chaperone
MNHTSFTPTCNPRPAPRARWLALILLAGLSGALLAQAPEGVPRPPDGGPGGEHGGPGGGPGGGPEAGLSPERLVERLRDPAMRSELKISDAQMSRLDTLSYQTEKSMIDLKGERQLVQLDLKRLLNADHYDASASAALTEKLVAVEGKMIRARLTALFEARRIFTDEQWQKLRSMGMQRMMERMQNRRQGEGQRPGGNRRMRGGPGGNGNNEMPPPPPNE